MPSTRGESLAGAPYCNRHHRDLAGPSEAPAQPCRIGTTATCELARRRIAQRGFLFDESPVKTRGGGNPQFCRCGRRSGVTRRDIARRPVMIVPDEVEVIPVSL